MTINPDRHSKGAPAAQGGQFKPTPHTECGVSLTGPALATRPIDWKAERGFTSFTADEIGSDFPADFIDAAPDQISAGLDFDTDLDSFDNVFESFLEQRYGAFSDRPDFEDEQVQLRFYAEQPDGAYTRGDAVRLLEDTKLRAFLDDQKSGKLEGELALYRTTRTEIADFPAARRNMRQYQGAAGWKQATVDAKAGKGAGLLAYAQEAARAVNELTPAGTRKSTAELVNLINRGHCDRVEALGSVDTALELLPTHRAEREGIQALRDWLTTGR